MGRALRVKSNVVKAQGVLSSNEKVLATPPTSYESYNSCSQSQEYIMQKEQLAKIVTQYSKCRAMSRIVRVKLPKPNFMISDISQDRAMNIDSDTPDTISHASSHVLFNTNKAIVRFPKLTLPPSPVTKPAYEKILTMKMTHNSLAGSISIHIKLPLPGSGVPDISMTIPVEMSTVPMVSTQETEITLIGHGEIVIQIPPKILSHSDSCVETTRSAPSTPSTPNMLVGFKEALEALFEPVADGMTVATEIFDAVPLSTDDTPIAHKAQQSSGAVDGTVVFYNNISKASELIQAAINVNRPH
jgi:hypothetical protein